GELAGGGRPGQVDLAVTGDFAEEAADVCAQRLAPAHLVAHAPDDVASRRGREHVVREHRVGRVRVAGEADRRQLAGQLAVQAAVLVRPATPIAPRRSRPVLVVATTT